MKTETISKPSKEIQMSKPTKVKMVKFHQAVQVGNAPVTYLTPAEYRSTPGGPAFSKVTKTAEGVEIEIAEAIIIVSWTNIAYMVIDKS